MTTLPDVVGMALLHISTNLFSSLLKALATQPDRSKADLPNLATILQMEMNELFPID